MPESSLTKTVFSNIETLLRSNPLFSRLSEEQLQDMRRYSRVRDLREGEILFNHGDPVENFYFVCEGLIKLYRQSAVGHEKIIELEGRGRTFAEALMFMEQSTYPVSASAMKDSTLVAISSRHFLSLLKKSPDTALVILGEISRRLHELVNEIENLSLHTGRNRVATYFHDQSLNKGHDFRLDIPKNAIASMLSLQPETFSRLLKELCNNKIIEVRENRIRILDPVGLKQRTGLN